MLSNLKRTSWHYDWFDSIFPWMRVWAERASMITMLTSLILFKPRKIIFISQLHSWNQMWKIRAVLLPKNKKRLFNYFSNNGQFFYFWREDKQPMLISIATSCLVSLNFNAHWKILQGNWILLPGITIIFPKYKLLFCPLLAQVLVFFSFFLKIIKYVLLCS